MREERRGEKRREEREEERRERKDETPFITDLVGVHAGDIGVTLTIFSSNPKPY